MSLVTTVRAAPSAASILGAGPQDKQTRAWALSLSSIGGIHSGVERHCPRASPLCPGIGISAIATTTRAIEQVIVYLEIQILLIFSTNLVGLEKIHGNT